MTIDDPTRIDLLIGAAGGPKLFITDAGLLNGSSRSRKAFEAKLAAYVAHISSAEFRREESIVRKHRNHLGRRRSQNVKTQSVTVSVAGREDEQVPVTFKVESNPYGLVASLSSLSK